MSKAFDILGLAFTLAIIFVLSNSKQNLVTSVTGGVSNLIKAGEGR